MFIYHFDNLVAVAHSCAYYLMVASCVRMFVSLCPYCLISMYMCILHTFYFLSAEPSQKVTLLSVLILCQTVTVLFKIVLLT